MKLTICGLMVLASVWSLADALPGRPRRSSPDHLPDDQHSLQGRESSNWLYHLWRDQSFQELYGQLTEALLNRHGNRNGREKFKPAHIQDGPKNDQMHTKPEGQVPSRYDGDIFFPTDTIDSGVPDAANESESALPKESSPKFNTSDCLDDLYCEHVDGYPSDVIAAKILESFNDVKDMFNYYDLAETQTVRKSSAASASADMAPFGVPEPSESTAPHTRLRPASAPTMSDDMPLCEARAGLIFPKKAKNTNNQWMLVVNQENMTQGIRTEKCMVENGKCAFADSFPTGFKPFCKQKFAEYKLLTYNEVTNKLETHVFPFPTCCSCHVKTVSLLKTTANVENRMLQRGPSQLVSRRS